MEYMNRNELFDLVHEKKGVHVSIYMPVEKEPDKLDVNRIRLKNLIKEAESKMAKVNLLPSDPPRPDADHFFRQAKEFSDNLNWQEVDGRGLAIFLEPTALHSYILPNPVEDATFIDQRFNIRPLLPLMTYNNDFYLLSLSQEKVQLWRGNRFELNRLEVPKLPSGMEEALALEDPERSLQFHTSTGRGDDRPAVHHGHEADKEKKGAILRYFRAVNDAVMIGLADEKAPLLIAAVDYLIPIYQEANTYPHLLDEGVIGNPDHLNPKTLHEKAWQTAEPHFNRVRETVIKQFREIKGTEISSQNVEEIVPAAANGRVDSLLIQQDTPNSIWGLLDQETNAVERCQEPSYECGDLLNLAAIKTLQNSGTVYPLNSEEMPSPSELAAIFRFGI